MVITIANASYINDYKIRLQFDDGKETVMDFEPFLRKSDNSMTNQYLDIPKFKSFRIDGDLVWGDFEIVSQLEICTKVKYSIIR